MIQTFNFFKIIKKFNIRARFEIDSTKLRAFHPKLYSQIEKLVGQKKDGYHILRLPMKKNFDLFCYLNKYRPSKIIELGSGTTSATFNYYAQSVKSSVLILESNIEWHTFLEDNIQFKTDDVKYLFCNIKHGDRWTMFDYAYDYADFVYVDGPPFFDENQFYNYDIIAMLERGIRPKTIVFDVRSETVKNTMDYIARNSLPYKTGKPMPGDFRHTVFELINPPLC